MRGGGACVRGGGAGRGAWVRRRDVPVCEGGGACVREGREEVPV